MQDTDIVKLIDTTKCTACRGCQVACKQWNEMPGKRTRNFGSYQDPDLQWNTWTLIRFQEHVDSKGTLKWLFRKDGCMHCTDAACVKVCPTGALHYTEFGSVGLKEDLCIGCKNCVAACPFEVPRYNESTDRITKCDLCQTRLQAGRLPACVLSCPTGALTIGRKDVMLRAAEKRVKELGGDANVYGDRFVGGTHVLYVLSEKNPEVYDALPPDRGRCRCRSSSGRTSSSPSPFWRLAAFWRGRFALPDQGAQAALRRCRGRQEGRG